MNEIESQPGNRDWHVEKPPSSPRTVSHGVAHPGAFAHYSTGLHRTRPLLSSPGIVALGRAGCGCAHAIRLHGARGRSDGCPAGDMATLPQGVTDALRSAEEVGEDLREVVGALGVSDACVAVCGRGEGASVVVRVSAAVTLLHGLEPRLRADWGGILRTLETLAPVGGAIEDGSSAAAELVGLAELAGVGSICGLANRAARDLRNLEGRFFRKSMEQGCFFRDVRMHPARFDELVSMTEPHLPHGLRGPAAIPPFWRIFSVLFWLAQGGWQRVIARAVDVAESTFSKFCNPVNQAMLTALPIPSWPDHVERRRIAHDFSLLTGRHAAGWAGL